MKVLGLPFTKRMGIIRSTSSEYLLQLNYSSSVLNHIGTIHASASFALAEITSGFFLKESFEDIAEQTIPILRSSNVKYKKAGEGILFSTAKWMNTSVKEIRNTLETKGKVLLTIQTKLYNDQKELLMVGEFEWFVTWRKD